MDTIFMNSWNSKTSNAYRIFLNLLDKINLKGRLNTLFYQTFIILKSVMHWKIKKIIIQK